MKHSVRWMMVILILTMAGLALSACSSTSGETAGKSEPAHLEPIEGTDLNRVTLTEKAAERLGIATELVRTELVARERTFAGEVEAMPEAPNDPSVVRVRVAMTEGDLSQLAMGQPGTILPLEDDGEEDDDEDESGLLADLFEADDLNDVEEEAAGSQSILYYQVNGANHGLAPGNRVRVKLPLAGHGDERVVVPYAAILYDLQGGTWIYVNPEPLVFLREPVTVDYILGDLAVLSEGPELGTSVVTVGVAELYGADTGVGK